MGETFGPVAPVLRIETEHEALALANDSPYGLAAYVFSYEGAPFGRVKESGLVREGSRHGLDEFTEIKYVCIDGLRSESR